MEVFPIDSEFVTFKAGKTKALEAKLAAFEFVALISGRVISLLALGPILSSIVEPVA